MNNTLVSNCERHYLINLIVGGERLDGRRLLDRQNVCLSGIFGLDTICINIYGSLIQLDYNYEVTTVSRSFENSLKINFDNSPLVILTNENRKSSEIQPSILKTLEKTLLDKYSAISASYHDLEKRNIFTNMSLNINILNCDGFILDTFSTALIIWFNLYYKPSSISIQNGEIIHSKIESPSTSLSLFHFPYTFSFGIMDNLTQAIYEPNFQEESVIDGKLMIGMNVQYEIMTLKLSGPVSILPYQIYACCNTSTSNLHNYNGLFNETISCLNNFLEIPGNKLGLFMYSM